VGIDDLQRVGRGGHWRVRSRPLSPLAPPPIEMLQAARRSSFPPMAFGRPPSLASHSAHGACHPKCLDREDPRPLSCPNLGHWGHHCDAPVDQGRHASAPRPSGTKAITHSSRQRETFRQHRWGPDTVRTAGRKPPQHQGETGHEHAAASAERGTSYRTMQCAILWKYSGRHTTSSVPLKCSPIVTVDGGGLRQPCCALALMRWISKTPDSGC
jgi:hypothetical protein